mmetsp:Transcript_42452/g.102219  ORF Transcript_42452/g.102219 Transcript_42452/m.102219 type:complete len:216 (+) Transcript_42452:2870-3517(+)
MLVPLQIVRWQPLQSDWGILQKGRIGPPGEQQDIHGKTHRGKIVPLQIKQTPGDIPQRELLHDLRQAHPLDCDERNAKVLLPASLQLARHRRKPHAPRPRLVMITIRHQLPINHVHPVRISVLDPLLVVRGTLDETVVSIASSDVAEAHFRDNVACFRKILGHVPGSSVQASEPFERLQIPPSGIPNSRIAQPNPLVGIDVEYSRHTRLVLKCRV